MSNIIFCATDYYLKGGYRSYVDLFRLVEMAGYPLIPISQINPDSDNTYIFTPANAETINGWPNAKAQIILWQLEWMLTDEHNTPPGVARVWASDAWFAKDKGYEYVPVGSDIGLNSVGSNFPLRNVFDVSLLSYQTSRRQVITHQLMDKGLVLAPISGLEGIRRSLTLVQSRAMVHVHQHDNVPGVAPLRWALAAAHGLPMITETVRDYGIFDYRYMMQSRYDTLADFVKNVVRDEQIMQDYGLSLQRLLCEEYSFKKVVEAHV